MTENRQMSHSFSRRERGMIYRPVSFTSDPRKTMNQIFLDAISGQVKDKRVTGNSQCRCTKGKISLTNLIASYDEMTGFMDRGTVVDDVYFDFSKAFGVVSHSQISEILFG